MPSFPRPSPGDENPPTKKQVTTNIIKNSRLSGNKYNTRAIEDTLDQYIPINYKSDKVFKDIFKAGVRPLGDSLRLYDRPDPTRRYTIGADVSTGRARDYSSFTIQDDRGEEAGCFKAKIPVILK